MKATLLVLTLLILAGCAAKPDYRPANNGSTGYSEQKISDDRYRVEFKSVSNSVADAGDFALLRAAELTQAQGYDWFVVTNKETFVDSKSQGPSSSISATRGQQIERRCGLITCETRSRPVNEVGVQISNKDTRKEVHTLLDIKMGKGIKPNNNSYSAQDVIDNLSSKAKN
ncbi:hypothetical protein [Pseudoalteromonas sp.]|uniref:CC0125/CC1285 family lipoprotein n=1 Tax=Pseudoalteromonas sp. TaxID=53249 RepID=UPI0035674ACA